MKKMILFVFLSIILQQLIAQQIFTDVTNAMGIIVNGSPAYGQAAGFCDIDNDGDLDIAFSHEQGGTFHLYRNDGNIFTEITPNAGLSGISASTILWAEITGDEYSDLITLNSIPRNNGNGTFTNITAGSGISGECRSVSDFNNDGYADILCLGTNAKIYYNNGTGVFSNLTVLAGSSIYSAVCLDYNNDNKMDIYFGNNGSGQNILYRNNGDGTFTDVTQSSGVSCSLNTSSVSVGDFNNDGYPDLYLGVHLGQLSQPANVLFKNNGDGTFTNVTTAAGVTGNPSTRTASFVDYSNDSWLDLFVDDHYKGNKLYKNNGDGTFTDVAPALNITGGFGDYFGTSWGDYNNDGAIDLFAVGHFYIYKLYENINCTNNYLTLRLHGNVTNHNAIGVKVKLYAGNSALTRFISVGDGMNDCHGLPVHFGLGLTNTVDSVEIFWKSAVQKLYNVSANQILDIVEGVPLGLRETMSENINSIQIRPNPAFGDLVISFKNNTESLFVVKIYNLFGEKMISEVLFKALSNQVKMNCSDLPPGVYILNISSNSKVFRTKFIKL
ncbi:MAG: T9SS type A sorting domain-containing protein [Bacteroidetes bacterium]|nr:T9SS type A sorting domain-containing protein [Bacteroidota bacterium]